MSSLTPDDFLAKGYKKFPNHAGSKRADFGLQKVIRDGDKKAYFITLWVYDWETFFRQRLNPKPHEMESWGFEPDVVMFPCIDGEYRQTQVSLQDFDTIEQLEEFYDKMYNIFGRIPDIHNN